MESVKGKSAAFVKWLEGCMENADLDAEAIDTISERIKVDEDDEWLIDKLSKYIVLSWAHHINGIQGGYDNVAFEGLVSSNKTTAIATIQAIVELLQAIGRGEKRPVKWEKIIN